MERAGITVSPLDRFPGYVVEVGLPPGWELFNSAIGVRVWINRTDPQIDKFCANAVLMMHRVEAALDPSDVFAKLIEQQVQSVPGCHELHRELAAATEGAGVTGALAMQITHELGTIDSVARSRIITAEQETVIAQLTVTALHDLLVDRANIWLTVRSSAEAGPGSAVPVVGIRDVR
ncbi:LpqN/LpqT family lipoprotein [Mycolicibacterium moriokaense]|uniref:Uncharacterized protein n=1 Tax=Mycolicibacterium moriokaense TaxID=39691 RepID=A0A318HP12_9MYCO|nr:LpqN/LpqT family lipoprotein [Mycolicibacterium moriokaense]PXX13193.1 hypothetical protein C8E89_101342 [Mycolicibacterium moriokaense]